MIRVSDEELKNLIRREGTGVRGPINQLGVLRLVYDLQDARAEVKRLTDELAKAHTPSRDSASNSQRPTEKKE